MRWWWWVLCLSPESALPLVCLLALWLAPQSAHLFGLLELQKGCWSVHWLGPQLACLLAYHLVPQSVQQSAFQLVPQWELRTEMLKEPWLGHS